MSYNYQNDAYHSKLFENYKSRLVEQKNQNVSQSQSQNLAERQKQIEDLKKAFPVQKASPLLYVGDIDREEYHITFTSKKNNKSFNIRMQIDFEFPQKRPKFYLERQYDAYYINKDTLEIEYYQYFPWSPTQSTLKDLVNDIDSMFTQSPLEFCDQIQLQAESCAYKIVETGECKQLNTLTLEKIFPKIQEYKKEAEYTKLSKQPEIINQQIQGTQEYLNLLQKCKENTEMLSNLSYIIKDTYSPLNDLKKQVNQKQEEFIRKLQEYLYLHGEIEKIQERFEIQGAIAIIDCEIQKLEDNISELVKNRFANDLNMVSKEFKKLKQQQNYLQLLKQQYLKSN